MITSSVTLDPQAVGRSSDEKIKPNDLTEHYHNCEKIADCYNVLVKRHKN